LPFTSDLIPLNIAAPHSPLISTHSLLLMSLPFSKIFRISDTAVHRLRCRAACRLQTIFEFVVSRFLFELTFVRRIPASYYLSLAYIYPRVWPCRARQPRPISLLYFCMLQLLPDCLTTRRTCCAVVHFSGSAPFFVSFSVLSRLRRPPHAFLLTSASCLATLSAYVSPPTSASRPRR